MHLFVSLPVYRAGGYPERKELDMIAHPECLRYRMIPPHPNPLPRRGEGDQGSDSSEAPPVAF